MLNQHRLFAPLIVTAITVIVCMPFEGKAKRAAPPEITPIVDGHNIYFFESDKFQAAKTQAHHYSLYLTKRNAADKNQDWTVKIYQVNRDSELESDVQDIWLKSLKKDGEVVVAIDERDEEYRVDSKSGALLKPKAFKTYEAKGR